MLAPATFSLFTRKLPEGWGYFLAAGLDDVLTYLESLTFDALLIPIVLCGAFAGRWLVRVTPQKVFEAAVIGLTAISCALLFR